MDKKLLMRYLPAALLLVGFGLVFSTRSQSAVPLAGSLSSVLPAWSGLNVREQTVTDDEKRVAGMSDYVARAFFRDSLVAFTTYVGYYDRQTQGKSMHSPRNCLPGAGWEVLRADTSLINVAGAPHVVNRYTLKNNGQQALVFYWYQGRGRVVANEYAVKWNLLRDAALEGHTEEALVRVMVPVRGARTLDGPALEKAMATAEQLGKEVSVKLLTDVERVLPAASGPTRTAYVAPAAQRVAAKH